MLSTKKSSEFFSYHMKCEYGKEKIKTSQHSSRLQVYAMLRML